MGEMVAMGFVHGRNGRHKWRGFRPYHGTDNNRGIGEMVAMGFVHGRNGRHGRCPWAKWSPWDLSMGEMDAINGVGFAPTMAPTIIVAGGVPSPHQPRGQFGLVCFAYRWIDLCAGRMAD